MTVLREPPVLMRVMSRRLRTLAAATAAHCLALAACSLTTSLDGLSSSAGFVTPDGEAGSADASGVPDAPGGGAPDASTGPDARDAAETGGTNLHPAGTFEDGTCAPWNSYQGTIGPSTTAHTGTRSCRACAKPSTTDIFSADDTGAPGPAIVGATYRAEGWVRTSPGDPAPPFVRLVLRNFKYQGNTFVDLESGDSPKLPIDATWMKFEVVLTVTKAGTLNVYLPGDAATGACFLLDDVVVQRIN
ncbi:MAG: hypothetical protein JWP87_2470 [Labilithrix sp.]|nr:hypothetical protein [Labilithrix sp.]